nr:hypothetical protein [Tanacetum cinerariifolium]
MTTKAQQSALDNAFLAQENQRVIGKCNIRINPGMKPKEPTYQVVLDDLALTTCYPAFLITAAVPIDNKDSKKQYKMFYPRLTEIIIHYFLEKYKSISMRNRTFMHTTRDDILLGAEPPKSKKPKRKYDSAISSEETPSKKKSTKAKKDIPLTKKPATKPKLTKKKAPVKADRGKSLNVLLEVALSEAAQLNEISGIDEGTCAKPWVPDVPKYDSESNKESWEENVDEFTNKEDDLNNANEENEEELDNGEELYKDVNVNSRKEDVEMTNVDQSGADQHNVSQESGFK